MTTQFISGLENYQPIQGRQIVATLGTFDGIHLGHQELLSQVRVKAAEMGSDPLLITFHPHPKVVVSPGHYPMLLTTIEEKRKFVPDFFDGRVLVMQFNRELQKLSAEEFVRIMVDKLGVSRLIVGYDHAFGRNRSGDTRELLELGHKYGFEVDIVDPVVVDGSPVSSTRIREAMKDNRFPEAVRLLGHEYAIFGTVERGIGLGRKLGYPTANVKFSHRKLLPPEGVYSCWAEIGQETKYGMMFIGRNHFNPIQKVTVEANLFDFDQDIYDQELIVYPIRFIRPNQRFDSKEALIDRITKDKEEVLKLIDKGE